MIDVFFRSANYILACLSYPCMYAPCRTAKIQTRDPRNKWSAADCQWNWIQNQSGLPQKGLKKPWGCLPCYHSKLTQKARADSLLGFRDLGRFSILALATLFYFITFFIVIIFCIGCALSLLGSSFVVLPLGRGSWVFPQMWKFLSKGNDTCIVPMILSKCWPYWFAISHIKSNHIISD